MSERGFLEEIDGVLPVYNEVIGRKNVTKPIIVENVMAHTINLYVPLFSRKTRIKINQLIKMLKAQLQRVKNPYSNLNS